MNTTGLDGNGVGGGEILDFINGSGNYNFDSPSLNNSLVRQYALIPIVLIIISIILIIIMIRMIMKIYGIKSISKSKGIQDQFEYLDKVEKRDKYIVSSNKLIRDVTRIVESSIFRSNKVNKEYVDYNLERAGIKIPGGTRYLKAEEFNAIIVSITAAVLVVSVIIGIVFSYMIAILLAFISIIIAITFPMIVIRNMVKSKDDEIRENFSDFYLMLHYVLLAGAKTPLSGIMKSYAKTTESNEMKRMVDTCVHYIDTYGEYEGASYISKAYREIPIMGKLMRLIRQANEGGDITSELMGFRTELLNEKRYAIERRTDKLINRAKASFNLLLPILFQAILSAMSIYMQDIGMASTFIGG